MFTMQYEGNLFLLPDGPSEAAVVTTNGIVKADGRLVMGAGIARYCRDRYAGIDEVLGRLVREHGNRPYPCGTYKDPDRTARGLDPEIAVFSCPTKNHWRDPSDLNLIADSCRILNTITAALGFRKVYIPALGCSLGGLDWKTQVEPVCAEFLDGRFIAAVPAAKLA